MTPKSTSPPPPRRSWLSLEARQAVFVGAMAMLTAGALGLVTFGFARAALRSQINQRLELAAAERGMLIEQFVAQQHERVALVASRTRLRRLIEQRSRGEIAPDDFERDAAVILLDARDSIGAFLVLDVLDLNGRVIASSEPRRVGQPFSAPEELPAGLRATHVGRPHVIGSGAKVYALAPTRGPDNEVLGAIAARVDAAPLRTMLSDNTGLGSTGQALLGRAVGDQVELLLPARRGVAESCFPRSQTPPFQAALAGKTGGGDIAHLGVEVLAAWRPVRYEARGEPPWALVLTLDASEAYAPVDALWRRFLLVGGAVTVVFSAGAYALTWRMLLPVSALEALADKAAREAAQGKPLGDAPVESLDVIGRLALTYNRLMYQVNHERATLQQRVEEATNQLQQANDELLEANERALRASQAKTDYLSKMSHEIRTPLNAILGMTNLVLQTDLTDTQREYLAIVQDSGDALLALINDVLDLAKIEAGKLEIEARPFSLREELGDTLKSFGFRAGLKGLELACHVPNDVPDALVGDFGRLRQVLTNLVGNAVKFTEQGEVVVEAACQQRDADSALLRFTVRDTGIGIPADKLALLFRDFSQVDSATSRKFGGTGLGLSISARLAELMGGAIGVRSVEGQGSEFHFTARMGFAAPGDVPPPLDAATLRGVRALIVDDNAANRFILEEHAREWGLRHQSAANAASAFDLLGQAHSRGEPFRLVLSDGHMPGEDGFELAQRIRADWRLADTPVVLLTSLLHPDDVARCRALGVTQHLMKPVKASELLRALLATLGAAPAKNGAARPPADADALGPLRLLLAEDNPLNQRLAISLLKKQGCDVTTVVDGRQAVEAWRAGGFDLILMDVQMPELDGLAATREIRRQEQTTGGHTPILAMTAQALAEDRSQCLAAGMDDYVSKPIPPQELYAKIRRLVRGE